MVYGKEERGTGWGVKEGEKVKGRRGSKKKGRSVTENNSKTSKSKNS
jgi:hypothetical protein